MSGFLSKRFKSKKSMTADVPPEVDEKADELAAAAEAKVQEEAAATKIAAMYKGKEARASMEKEKAEATENITSWWDGVVLTTQRAYADTVDFIKDKASCVSARAPLAPMAAN